MEAIKGSLAFAILAVIGGLIGVLVGADLLVNGSVSLARTFGVSEEVIGLTLVVFFPILVTWLPQVVFGS